MLEKTFREIRETAYWTESFRMTSADHDPPLDFPAKTDLAIIGGGLTGLSTALDAAKKGAKIVLFEQETVGWGASTRNAGMALTGLKLSPEKLVKKYGREKGQQFFQSS